MQASFLDGKVVTLKPEYSNCADIAASMNIPLKEFMSEVNVLAQRTKSAMNMYE